MSIIHARRQLPTTVHEEDEIQFNVAEALLYPNYVLDDQERSEVNRNITFEVQSSDLGNDYEANLTRTASERGIDYAKNSLATLGFEHDAYDRTSLYSIFGGPEGENRHLYGQGLPISLKRQFPTRAWNAPAISALGTGIAQPGQNTVTPMNLSANRVQKFMQAMSHLVQTENVDSVQTSAPNLIAGVLQDSVHNSTIAKKNGTTASRGPSIRIKSNRNGKRSENRFDPYY